MYKKIEDNMIYAFLLSDENLKFSQHISVEFSLSKIILYKCFIWKESICKFKLTPGGYKLNKPVCLLLYFAAFQV